MTEGWGTGKQGQEGFWMTRLVRLREEAYLEQKLDKKLAGGGDTEDSMNLV